MNAVIYEQVGSVSVFVFRLPVIRVIPRRVPAVARYFAVDYVATRDAGAHAEGADEVLQSSIELGIVSGDASTVGVDSDADAAPSTRP